MSQINNFLQEIIFKIYLQCFLYIYIFIKQKLFILFQIKEFQYLDAVYTSFKDIQELQDQQLELLIDYSKNALLNPNTKLELNITEDEMEWFQHYKDICMNERQLKKNIDQSVQQIPDKYKQKITNQKLRFDPKQQAKFLITEMLNKYTSYESILQEFCFIVKTIVDDKRYEQQQWDDIFKDFLVLQYDKACIEKKFSQIYVQVIYDLIGIEKVYQIAKQTNTYDQVHYFLKIICQQEDINNMKQALNKKFQKILIQEYIANEIKCGRPKGEEYQINDQMNEQDKNIILNNIVIHLSGSIQYLSTIFKKDQNKQLLSEYSFLSSLILALQTQFQKIAEVNQIQNTNFCRAKDINSIEDAQKQIQNIQKFLKNCQNSQDSTLIIKIVIKAIKDNCEIFQESNKSNKQLKQYLIGVIQNIDERFLDSYLVFTRQQMLDAINQVKSNNNVEMIQQDISNINTIKLRSLSIPQIIDYAINHTLEQLIKYIIMCDENENTQQIIKIFTYKLQQDPSPAIFDVMYLSYYQGQLLKKFIGEFSNLYKQTNDTKQKDILFKYILLHTFNAFNDIYTKQKQEDLKLDLQSCMKFINKHIVDDKDKTILKIQSIIEKNNNKNINIYPFIQELLKLLIQQTFEEVVQEELYDLIDEDTIENTIQLIKKHEYYKAQTQQQIQNVYQNMDLPDSLQYTENISDDVKSQMLTPFDKQVITKLRKVFSIDIHQKYQNLVTFKQLFKYLASQSNQNELHIFDIGRALDYGGLIHVVPEFDLSKRKLDKEFKPQIYQIEYMMYQLYTNERKEFKSQLIQLFKQKIKENSFSYYQFLELLWTYVLDKNYAKELKSYMKILDKQKVLACIEKLQEQKIMYGTIQNLYQTIQ